MSLAPFQDNVELWNELKSDLERIINYEDDSHLSDNQIQERLENLCKWLSSTPQCTVFRVNTLLTDRNTALIAIKNELLKSHSPLPEIQTLTYIPELIVIRNWDTLIQLNLERHSKEIIVDEACGAAVLKGAHVFAPGIIGIPHGLKENDIVSIYASSPSLCKKGCIKVNLIQDKLFIGNGILRMTREDIFGHNTVPTGIAVDMIAVTSRVPQLNERILPTGHILLQNLPSIICTRVLDPKPNETVLDMCAAPGNKTTHIAQLMKNQGTLIALEKSKRKFEKLVTKCAEFGATVVSAYCLDSTTCVGDAVGQLISAGPPFSRESFDRVLLDGPCSALGQRPQIRNKMSANELRSFPRLQRNLFSTAVELLKTGGTLVYSTCSITVAENEGIVAWALDSHPNLEVISVPDQLAQWDLPNISIPGHRIPKLTVEQSAKLCRFDCGSDGVGFFIACFRKGH